MPQQSLPVVVNVGAVRLPIFRISMRVARNLPAAARGLAEDIRAARDDDSPGDEKVTVDEVGAIVAHLFERLAEGVLPMVLRANGLH